MASTQTFAFSLAEKAITNYASDDKEAFECHKDIRA